MMRIEEIGQVAARAVDDQGVLREVIRADREKSTSFASLSLMSAAAGVSIMMPISICLS